MRTIRVVGLMVCAIVALGATCVRYERDTNVSDDDAQRIKNGIDWAIAYLDANFEGSRKAPVVVLMNDEPLECFGNLGAGTRTVCQVSIRATRAGRALVTPATALRTAARRREALDHRLPPMVNAGGRCRPGPCSGMFGTRCSGRVPVEPARTLVDARFRCRAAAAGPLIRTPGAPAPRR